VKSTFRLLALLAATCAFAVVPAIGQARHKPDHPKPHYPEGPAGHDNKRCKKPAKNVGFVVRGTLTAYTADDSTTTPANEASVTITVTGANRHARNSGELADTDPVKKGTQVKGDSYTVTGATDPFKVKLAGFEPGETPAVGDSVKIKGKIARTKKKCAPAGTSVADLYGDVDVRKVDIHDAD
jgi:hypothetical protein